MKPLTSGQRSAENPQRKSPELVMQRALECYSCVHRVPSRRRHAAHKVGARELKQHTGEIIERVRRGERVLLTHRGEAVAMISPIDREAVERAVEAEARRAEEESLGWLSASEGAFSFWENEEDEVWDEMSAHCMEK